MERKQFTFYRSFWESIKLIKNKSDRLSALEGVIAYALDGELRPMTDVAEGLFCLIQPVLLAAAKKSEGRQNREAAKNAAEKESSEAQDTVKIPSRCEQETVKEKEKEKEREGEKEKEKERESEREKESYIKLLSLSGGGNKTISEAEPKKQIENKSEDVWGFGEDLKDALRLWMDYKKEKRQTVKPAQVDALLKQVKSYADKYGEEAVASVIRSSIANGYAGIVFDRLDKQAPEKEKPWNRGVMRHGDAGVNVPTDAALERLRAELGK